MRLFLLVAWVLVLTSCAAVYSYDHETAAGEKCHVGIYSRREVGGPVSFEADKDCGVKAGTGSLTGGQLTSADNVVQGVVDSVLDRTLGPKPAPAAPAQVEQPKQ
jgi:hypothetical protein